MSDEIYISTDDGYEIREFLHFPGETIQGPVGLEVVRQDTYGSRHVQWCKDHEHVKQVIIDLERAAGAKLLDRNWVPDEFQAELGWNGSAWPQGHPD